MTDSAEIIAIADGVVAALNAAAGLLPDGAVVQRLYRPVFTLEDLATLHITVVPKHMDSEPHSRAAWQFDYAVDVAVQQRVDAADNVAACDALMLQTEQIASFFRAMSALPAPLDAVQVAKVKNDPVFAPDHLEDRRVFTSPITVYFKVIA